MSAGTQLQTSGKVGRQQILVVGVVVAGAFMSLLNQTVMSPALPGLMTAFNINAGDAQWVTSIYMLVNGIMVPVSAWLIDKFSTRALFFASTVVFAAGTVLCAVAPAFGVLLVGRVLQAAAAGVQLPLVATVPLLVFPPEKRGTAMGMAGIVMSAGPAIGPVVGGAIIDSFGWRMMFWAIVPLAVAVLLFAVVCLKNVGELKNPKLDIPSVALSTVAFGGLLYGFSSASNAGWASPLVVAPIAVGLVSLVVFIRRQGKLEDPLLRLETLRTPAFRSAAIIVTLVNAAVAATNVTLPIFLQNALGVSALETGMVMLPAAAVGIVLSPVSGIVFDKFGARVIGIVGLAIMTVALFALGTVHVGTAALVVTVLCATQATGQALANMPINTWGVNSLANDMIAHGNAIANTGRQVFGAMATALFVTVMTSVTSSAAAAGADAATATAQGVGASYLCCGAVALVSVIVTVVAVKGRKAQVTRSTIKED